MPDAVSGRISTPLTMRGPLLALGHKDKSLFDVKLTQQEEYRFNGTKGGMAYTKKVENYFISQAPIIRELLKWAEHEDLNTINHERCVEAVGGALTHDQVYMINGGVWANDLGGLDAWRRVTSYITNG